MITQGTLCLKAMANVQKINSPERVKYPLPHFVEPEESIRATPKLAEKPMQKCSLCASRIDQGLLPSCVIACLGDAIQVVE